LNFKASAAETGIFYGLKIAFLESTGHRIFTNDLLVYQKQFVKIYKAVYSRCIIEKDVKVNIIHAVSNHVFY
jgi:hypothetical protein